MVLFNVWKSGPVRFDIFSVFDLEWKTEYLYLLLRPNL
jgi:hypothetical protein